MKLLGNILHAPHALTTLVLAASLATLVACGGDDAPSGSTTNCDGDDDCSSGQTCEAGACVDVGDTGVADDTSATDSGESDTGIDDTSVTDADEEDVEADASSDVGDSGTELDTTESDAEGDVETDAQADAGDDIEEDTGGNPTLADYLPCDADSDCPVGLGNCITEIPLNRADDVLGARVAISDLAPEWPSDGVCSLTCTSDASVCETLSLRDGAGRPVEFECQLVVEGSSLYPELAPPFPFDDELDAEQLGAGAAFGAICRPPFELDPTRSSEFCASCAGGDDCGGDDICWSFSTRSLTETSGMCLQPCSEDATCPVGFICDEFTDGEGDDALVLGSFCAPIEQTCGDCRDLDGDRRGVGRCGASSSPVSEYDCDDFNPDAFYSSIDADHPFPEFCGEIDYNCNGISDATEQVGADAFPVEHCTACGDVCEGVEPNATRQCRTDVDGSPFCAVVCDDPESFADCTPDPGCETPVDDPTRLFYRDADGDGAGDPSDVVFACTLGAAPDGYVSNSADCNDENDAAYGAFDGTLASAEVCDGVDNDCNDEVDEAILEIGDSCSTGLDGVCATGSLACMGVDGLICVPDVSPGTVTEVCDGEDNDCDGDIDEEEDIPEIGDECTADAPGICAFGTRICEGRRGLVCEAGSPEAGVDWPDVDGTDSDCDGIDGDESRAIFVRAGARDGAAGTRADPVRTLSQAAALITTSRYQILMENGVYEASSSITISARSAVVGGYRVTAGGDWIRDRSARADLRFTSPTGSGDALGVRINGAASRRYLFMDLDVRVGSEGADGESITGWACSRCNQASFMGVTIEAQAAVDGENGSEGTGGALGEPGTEGINQVGAAGPSFSCPGFSGGTEGSGGAGGTAVLMGLSEANGQPGTRGAGSLGGAGGSSRSPERNGDRGDDATRASSAPAAASGGHNPGTPSASAGSASDVWWTRADGEGGARGAHGGGGGGGGGGSASLAHPTIPAWLLFGGGGGSGGAPGCGGEGGNAGAAGGSSVALWLDSSDGIAFDDVELVAGNGGRGGTGGPGGVGGSGGAGGAGFVADGVQNGANGGAGSGGGGGGGGGGGAGGSSYCIMRDGGTSVETGSIECELGTPGTGGDGGSGGGGGLHGNADFDDQSVGGPDGRSGANGEALIQRVR